MNKIFNIMAGTGDYKHVMFSTTDWSKASNFVISFNMQFDVNDLDTYDAYHAYIEEIDNFVPKGDFGKYASGNATVYTVKVYDGGVIKPAEIYGNPLYDYIDLRKTWELDVDVEKLQHLLDHEYCIDFDVFGCDAVVKILIVDADTLQSFDITHNSDISGHMLNHLVKRASTIYRREKQYAESMNETESE
jgi:hypothetical protein